MTALRISHQNRAIGAATAGGEAGRAEHADDGAAGFAATLGAAAAQPKDAAPLFGGDAGGSADGGLAGRKRGDGTGTASDATAAASGAASLVTLAVGAGPLALPAPAVADGNAAAIPGAATPPTGIAAPAAGSTRLVGNAIVDPARSGAVTGGAPATTAVTPTALAPIAIAVSPGITVPTVPSDAWLPADSTPQAPGVAPPPTAGPADLGSPAPVGVRPVALPVAALPAPLPVTAPPAALPVAALPAPLPVAAAASRAPATSANRPAPDVVIPSDGPATSLAPPASAVASTAPGALVALPAAPPDRADAGGNAPVLPMLAVDALPATEATGGAQPNAEGNGRLGFAERSRVVAITVPADPSSAATVPTGPAPTDTAAATASPDPAATLGTAPDGVARLADQVADQVLRMVSNGSREMVMRLHPPELGELTVRVAVSGRDVAAWFASAQPQVQNAISAAIGQLHTGLGNAGYNLNGAWIGADASSARQQQDAPPPAPPSRNAAIAMAPAAAPPVPARPDTSGLNIYV